MEVPTHLSNYNILFILFCLEFSLCTTKEDAPCPEIICKCYSSSKKAICTYSKPTQRRHSTYIPKFPGYVTEVKMTNNRLRNMSRETLKNLTDSKIKSLLLIDNKITTMEQDAFQDLRYLKYMEINRNVFLTAGNLSLALCGLNKTIFYKLRLMHNKWTDIPINMFECLFGSNLEILSLEGNDFRTIHREIFSGLSELQELDLSYNQIVEFAPFWYESLRKLDLRNNLLLEIPQFCSNNGSFIPRLRSLYLDNNRIMHISKLSFGCLENLLKLTLSGNFLRILKNNTFSLLTSLQTLYVNNFGSQLKILEPVAFNCSRLQKLMFTGNNFRFDDARRYSPKHVFAVCPNLIFLELTNSILPSNSWTLRNMFLPLKNIQKLILQATGLKMLPRDLFPNLHSLHTLHLSGNHIHGWQDSPYVFGNSTSLRYLNFDGNNLDLINQTSFSQTMLNSLEKLNLANNPFSCSCQLTWFSNWIRKTNVTLINYPDRYKCSSPPEKAGILLKDFDPSPTLCRQEPQVPVRNHIVPIIIVLCVIAITLTVIIVVVYKCRWHIRYWVYLLRYKNRPHDQFEDCFLYDGFIVYCEEDRKWVHENLLTKLEECEGLKLCIHFRDFVIGKLIVDNIVESIAKSRKVVLVLSNNFAKSEWCQFELRLVQIKFLNNASDNLVLVMFEEIKSHHLSSSLKTLITTTTYATWTDNKQGQKQFWDQIVTALKR